MKVISYALWGNIPLYCIGSIENVKLQKEIYSDWKCRFYIDETVNVNVLDRLYDLGAEIIYCVDDYRGFKKLFRRFLVAGDKHIDRFIIRDCDSRLNLREKVAVDEWCQTEFNYHIMRDSMFHGLQIMGGMWGGTGNCIPNIKSIIEDYCTKVKYTHNKDFYQIDQMFLKDVVWNYFVNGNHVAHDDKKRITGKELPFQVKLNNDMFVGQVFDEKNNPQSETRVNPLI